MSLDAKPAGVSLIPLIFSFLSNTSGLLALPIWGLSYKNVYLVVVWKRHFSSVMELCQSHCGREVRNGTPTLILHLAVLASPGLAKPSAAKNEGTDGHMGSQVAL